MTQTIPARSTGAVEVATECPHCHKEFAARIDASQPPRLQGAKCPNCKLFVPARLLPGAPAPGGRFPKPAPAASAKPGTKKKAAGRTPAKAAAVASSGD